MSVKINIRLSVQSIEKAIELLKNAKEALTESAGDLAEEMALQGGIVAQASFGHMARVDCDVGDKPGTAVISVSGKAPIIAEFGAGYATMEDHPWAKKAPVPIEVGSYSRQNDSMYGGMFALTDFINPGEGYWIFAGRFYSEVEPRHGLLDAGEHIKSVAAEDAARIIRLR